MLPSLMQLPIGPRASPKKAKVHDVKTLRPAGKAFKHTPDGKAIFRGIPEYPVWIQPAVNDEKVLEGGYWMTVIVNTPTEKSLDTFILQRLTRFSRSGNPIFSGPSFKPFQLDPTDPNSKWLCSFFVQHVQILSSWKVDQTAGAKQDYQIEGQVAGMQEELQERKFYTLSRMWKDGDGHTHWDYACIKAEDVWTCASNDEVVFKDRWNNPAESWFEWAKRAAASVLPNGTAKR